MSASAPNKLNWLLLLSVENRESVTKNEFKAITNTKLMYWLYIVSKNTSSISELYIVFLIPSFNLLFSIYILEEPNVFSIRNPSIEYIKKIIFFPLKVIKLASYKII